MIRSLGSPRIWLVWLTLQLPSLRALFKYLLEIGWLLIPLYLIATLLFTALLLNGKTFRRTLARLSTAVSFAILLLVILAANVWLYPIAEARSEQGGGSDQDNALIITGERLWEGRNPYKGEIWPLESAAAGPGWVILASPLAANGLYVLLNPLIILLSASLIAYLRKSFFSGLVFLLLLMSSLAFWELTITGSDMISIGCLILLATIAVYHGWQRGGWAKFLSALLLACVATGRAVFFYLVPLLAAFQRKRNSSGALGFLTIAGGLFTALHLAFYLWTPKWYLPLHVFWKGEVLLGFWLYLIAGLICIVVVYLAARRVGNDLPSWLFNCWITVALGMLCAALGDLWSSSFVFARWEGANYLGVAMPLLAGWAALRLNSGQIASEEIGS